MTTKLSFTVRLTLLILLTAMVLAFLIGGAGWLMGWRTPTEFSNGFFVVGAAVTVLGAYAALGGFRQRADFGMTYARTVSPASLSERTKQMVNDMNQGYGSMIFLVTIGLVLIIISVLIPGLFG